MQNGSGEFALPGGEQMFGCRRMALKSVQSTGSGFDKKRRLAGHEARARLPLLGSSSGNLECEPRNEASSRPLTVLCFGLTPFPSYES